MSNKREHRSLPILKLHVSRLVWGLELRSDHPKAWVLFVEETRAERSLESLREWQPQDFWVKRGSGAAANWPELCERDGGVLLTAERLLM